MTATRPRIVVTQGDPKGIGPEILVRSLPHLRAPVDVTVIADPDLLERACELTDAPLPSAVIPTPESGPVSALWALEEACRQVREEGVAGIVTAPIHKAALTRAGFTFPGHTEFLGARLGGVATTMMLAGDALRVALVTTHMPLADVPAAITVPAVTATVLRVDAALRRWYAIERPRIAVLGLNPHAGEEGLFGNEDRDVVASAVAACRAEDVDCSGPLPGDATFAPRSRVRFDAVVAMYHDQGLAALKAVEGGRAVNVTLGLPVPRTSPDHGSARDIAGKGVADPASMLAALRAAARFVLADPESRP